MRSIYQNVEILEAVKVLLECGADVNLGKNDGWPALHHAAHKDMLDMVKFLLKNGANPNINSFLETPLYIAAKHGKKDICVALLRAGADKKKKSYGETPESICPENLKYLFRTRAKK